MSDDNPVTPGDSPLAALIEGFFAAVSFPAGGRPAYEQLPGLFTACGRLIRNTPGNSQDLSVAEFVADRLAAFGTGQLTSFSESEISARTEAFGRIGHRLSTYTKSGVLDGAGFAARGVISTQFVEGTDGWRISSMAWDDERTGLSLPLSYR
jgi:hypothetical protein